LVEHGDSKPVFDMTCLPARLYKLQRTGVAVKKKEILQKHKEYLFSCVANYYEEPLVVDHANGSHVYDVEGREYLDFLAAF
jgi:4-aminobutyrate aminotransferase-like enzyme